MKTLRNFPLFFMLLALGLGLGCTLKKPKLEQKQEEFKKSFKDCNPDKPDCTYVKFSYPEFTGGTQAKALEKLNDAAQQLIKAPFWEGASMAPEAFTKKFFQEYEEAKKQFPKAPWSYVLERSVSAEQVSPKILNLSMTEYSYTGGAHPNTYSTLQNFSPKTGDKITLKDLLKPGEESKLAEIGEKVFREKMNVPPKENLEEAGFFFKDGIFTLSDNYLMRPEGLIFLYNPYEAAAYAVGPIKIVIPWDQLKGIYQPKVLGFP